LSALSEEILRSVGRKLVAWFQVKC